LGGYNIPVWGVGVAAIVAVMVLSGGKR
jgi:hypothetical protein